MAGETEDTKDTEETEVTEVSILDLIKMDHQKTIRSLEELKATSTKTVGVRDDPYMAVRRDLVRHMHAEERVFYPALEPVVVERVLEAFEEHSLIKILLDGLDDLPKDDLRWTARLKVLIENVRHHVKEEEGPIFRAAEEAFSQDQLKDMGRRFEDAKETAPRFG